jgi:hypothetical protein
MKLYWYIFADGYRYGTRGLSRCELAAKVRKHGRLVSKVPA